MRQAARAIIIENDKFLVMHRSKQGSEYFTLVGGRVNEGENLEQALVREVREETGLVVTEARLVFYEKHPDPYNEQYIYLCQVAPHTNIAIQEASEEAQLNRTATNVHQPLWVNVSAFEKLAFRTPQLQNAIAAALRKGFPSQPVQL
jgi:ADP-ribose pyrophosphatase YjhB (NUDIX family)